MLTKIITFFKKNLYLLIIAFLAIFLSWQNYSSNTWLSGWDTLHPEFDFPLAFERILNGVWRTDQGLGAVAIQSHMSELPRIIYLWLASLIIPLSFLRYSYFFLMLIAGPLGIYFLVSELLKSNQNSKVAGFIAGLTYLMNLGTLQHFVVPLEMFATHFGLIPWLFLLILKLLEKPIKRLWLIFFFFSFFASSQAHTATLFYAYFVCLMVVLVGNYLLHRTGLIISGLIIAITLTVNAYWLLPNLYVVKTQGFNVRNSKVNRMFSPEALAKNQMFGNIENTAVLKSFLFDWEIYNYDPNNSGYTPLLKVWNKHAANPLVPIIGYGVFIFSLIGIFAAIRQKNYKLLVFLPVYGISFLMLLNGTWPIKDILEKVSQTFPVLAEALRFPFTKFSILYMLTMSLYVSHGFLSILELFKKHKKCIILLPLFYGMILIFYFLPAFQGNLIHQQVKINIPQRYFQMFDWFSQQDKAGRVAILPIHTFWNWIYYDWGYQGAGFLQFGIPQPILDRDYDRWSPYNEQYQREMAQAIYGEDPELLKVVLKKYNIRYVLFDESVISMGSRDEETFKWAIPGILNNTGIVTEVAKFDKTITVYEVAKTGKSVSLLSNPPSIGPKFFGGSEDIKYLTYGSYITKEENNEIVDTFRSGFTNNEQFTENIKSKKYVGGFSAVVDSPSPLVSCSSRGLSGTRERVGNTLQYRSQSGPLCDHFSFPYLSHDKGYLIEITSRYQKGFPLQICISNDFSRHCDLFVYLDKNEEMTTWRYLLPPKNDMASGYTVNLNNFSVKNQISENELREINIFEVDYNTISERTNTLPIILNNNFLVGLKNINRIADWNRLNFWLYKIILPKSTKDNEVLSLSQSFNSGWVAIWNKGILTDHVLVNNWANGWILPTTQNSQPTTVYLIYLPQILEFLGFGLGIVTLLYLLKPRHDPRF